MKWNLRMVAAQREIWKASQLQAMLAEAGLVISAGKMSHLWAGNPVTIRLDDLEVICSVLDCAPNDLMLREQAGRRADTRPADPPRPVAAGEHPIQRRHVGRATPPL